MLIVFRSFEQDRLRNKWSLVMSEVESQRTVALTAEDQLKEMHQLLDSLDDFHDKINTKQVLHILLVHYRAASRLPAPGPPGRHSASPRKLSTCMKVKDGS